MPTKSEKDAIAHAAETDQATTGHEWDGIREYDTPLPKWWLYTFYASIVVAVIMVILYPSIPGIGGYFHGVLDRQERRVLDDKLEVAAAAQAGMRARIAEATPAEIEANPEMLNFALVGGEASFADNCAPCHGLGGGGLPGGYPVLADDDWIWGGTLDDIHQTILVGIRGTDSATRTSQMPAFGQLGMLDRTQVNAVADYVLSLSGREHDEAALEAGAALYGDNCAACHGAAGLGDQALGAPSLADQIWLYGDTREEIVTQIWNPRQGVMPTWGGRLDPATINMLTVYVHNLGGGQ